ncbi:MAG: hypothetical protein ACOX1X_08785 [Dethiobacteria bacterium]|jgi:hypothetical protein
MEEKKETLLNYPGSFRKRHLLRTKKGAAYNLYQPALNLSPEEYNKMLEEIKKRGNMG